jgi:hypothetical protein
MDLKKYDKLRKKIDTKDFEGANKELDKWLFNFSFVGNASSIFFAYFLVFPSLLKAISANFITGDWGMIIAFILTLVFLSIFEIIKRYFVRNFSNDFVKNQRKLGFKMLGWLIISMVTIILSFYLSINGSKNLAITNLSKYNVAKTEISSLKDSLNLIYDEKISVYVNDNKSLRAINIELREKLKETPLNYITARKEYQNSIDKNTNLIKDNNNEIKLIKIELQSKIEELQTELSTTKSSNEDADTKNKILFIIIVCFNELIIIGGLYFREYFEYNLYVINQDKFENIYKKKDRYRALITFIYRDGKLNIGDRVMSGLELKAAVAEKAKINNSNKFVDEFLRDMDRLNIFTTVGKRRNIATSFIEALDIIENFDDTYRILENMK